MPTDAPEGTIPETHLRPPCDHPGIAPGNETARVDTAQPVERTRPCCRYDTTLEAARRGWRAQWVRPFRCRRSWERCCLYARNWSWWRAAISPLSSHPAANSRERRSFAPLQQTSYCRPGQRKIGCNSAFPDGSCQACRSRGTGLRTNCMPSDPPSPCKLPFLGLGAEAAAAELRAWGWPEFRATQLYDWVYHH